MVVHTFRTQRQSDLSEFEASLVYSEFQDSQDCYTEKPCLGGEKRKKEKRAWRLRDHCVTKARTNMGDRS